MDTLIHGNFQKVVYRKKPKEQDKVCECPACREQFNPQKLLFFPREIWHPRRTYDFFKGYECSKCGYLATREQLNLD